MVNFRRFNGSSDVVTLALGGLSTMTSGTIAVLCRRTDETAWNGAFATRNGSTPELYIDIAPSGSSNFLWYNYASAANAGVAVAAADDWCWTIINKATGSSAPRTHKRVQSTGVWTRANGSAIGDATSPSGGDLQIGNAGGDFFKGDIAAIAVWTTSVADAVLDGMVNSWPAVLAANPQAAWLLNQASTGTNITDAVGSANQTALSGTTVQTGTIPNWSETAASTGYGATGTANHPGRGPSRYARFLQTARSTTITATANQVAVAQAAETDSAQPVGRTKTRPIGQVAEADVAQPIGRSKRRAVGQATETDVAQPVGRAKLRATGQATETDLAQVVGRVEQKAVGQASEVDAAQPITRQKRRTVGQAQETDTAQPVARVKQRLLGQAVETDLAQPVSRLGQHLQPVGQATETDVAQPIRAVKRRSVNQASETCLAQTITRRHARGVGQASESGTAQPITRRKLAHVGQVAETDTAQPIGHGGAVTRREYWGMVV